MGSRGLVFGKWYKSWALNLRWILVVFNKSIGMGYIRPDLAKEGQKLKVKMLNSLWDAEVTCDSPYDPSNETIRKDG